MNASCRYSDIKVVTFDRARWAAGWLEGITRAVAHGRMPAKALTGAAHRARGCGLTGDAIERIVRIASDGHCSMTKDVPSLPEPPSSRAASDDNGLGRRAGPGLPLK